jgi:stearoyl-CoA desaturase (delta-9 desaturase)
VAKPPLDNPENSPLDSPVSLDDFTPARESTELRRHISRPPSVDAQSRIIWSYVIGVTLFHLLIPLAFLSYFFSWWGVLWLPVGNYIFCSLGIGAGFHRLLTHRGFKCPLWLEHTPARSSA